MEVQSVQVYSPESPFAVDLVIASDSRQLDPTI